jgi:hypothetical protein
MLLSHWFKRFTPLLLSFVLLITACSSPPSKYDQVQEDTTGFRAERAADRQAERGGRFNQFFPSSENAYEVIPSQEKAGFAEYKLKQNGETLAMLTINDTISVPAAAAKYESATETIAGYPAVNQGTTMTGILVNGRYQVKVLSRSDAFTQADREAWIQKFDLAGLSQLDAKSAIPQSPQQSNKVAPLKAPNILTPSQPVREPASDLNLQPAA